MEDDGFRQQPDGSSARAAQPPTRPAQQQAPRAGTALHGRREFEIAGPAAERSNAESALDRARAHARASAQAQQAAAQHGGEQGDFRPSAEALAAVQALAAAQAATAVRPRELRPQDQKPVDRFGGIHALQIVAAEIAVLSAIALHRHSLVLFVPVLLAALVVLVLAFGRYRGKWLYQWFFLGVRFCTRRRSRVITGSGAQFRPFTRGSRVDQLEVDDERVGILRHQGGFTAVIEPVYAQSAGRSAGGGVLPPLGDLLPASNEAAPPVSLQVLVHTIPAPGQLTSEDAAASSYAELAGGTIPGQRRALIAVQVQHVAGTFLPADLDATLVNALRRLRRKLTKAGFEVGLLNRDELDREFAEVVQGALSTPGDEVSSTQRVREGWREWHAGSARHVTYRIVGWPNLADRTGARLVEYISAAPSLDTTVAIAARNVDGIVHVEAAVRLQSAEGASPDALRASLTEVVEQCGATLERLDGRHAFGMSASVPLGGFAA